MTPLDRIRTRLLRSRLVRETGWSFILKVASTALGFLVAVVLARALGPDGYGVYAYALAIVTLLSLPAQIGMPALLTRETARGRALDQPELVRGIWVWGGRVAGGLSLLLVLGAVVVLALVNAGEFDSQARTLLWAFLLVPLVTLGNLRGAALRGLGKVIAGQFPEFILRPAFLLASAAVFLVVVGSLTPPQAMSLHVLAAGLAFIWGAWLLLRNTPTNVRRAARRFESEAWRKSVWPLALMAGLATINNQADILILGWFRSSDQIGIYKVAIQMATFAAFGLQVVNLVVAPRFARLHALNDMAKLQRLATGSARLTLVAGVGVTIVFIVIGEQLLNLAFGESYLDSYAPLLVMLAGQLANAAAGSAGQLLTMTGNERDSARAMVVAVLLNVALNLALIPRLGVMGAATATAISLTVRNLGMWWAVRRRLGIDSTAFAVRRSQGT